MLEISDLRRREILHLSLRSVCPFSPRGIFLGVKILNFNIYFFLGGGGFRKLNFLGGIKISWIFLGGHHKLYFEVISMHFRVFSEGQGTEWRIFLGLLKVQIFI